MATQTDSLDALLYDKTYDCPVCFTTFTTKAIRLNTNKALSSDIDLYTRYSEINPLLYEIIVCPTCAYAASNKNFDRILPTQATWIKEQVTAHYKKRHLGTYPSIKDAIFKHQLALICAIVKKSKFGEQGYLALHIAWLYRDLNDTEQEKAYLAKALYALSKALETERFPLFNLDATTTSYIIAAIHYQLGDYEAAKRYLADVILSSQGQLKERALDLKNLLSEAT